MIQLLKKKDKFAELSKVDCFTVECLIVLLRELNSTLPKPNRISDFKAIARNTIDSLEKIGITNTEKLYDKVVKKSDRQKLTDSTGIEYKDILELTKLSDLSRIKWVGVTYSQILYDLGVDTVGKVSESDPIVLHEKINQMIKEENLFKGAIGLNDVKILIESVRDLLLEIEYMDE